MLYKAQHELSTVEEFSVHTMLFGSHKRLELSKMRKFLMSDEVTGKGPNEAIVDMMVRDGAEGDAEALATLGKLRTHYQRKRER